MRIILRFDVKRSEVPASNLDTQAQSVKRLHSMWEVMTTTSRGVQLIGIAIFIANKPTKDLRR